MSTRRPSQKDIEALVSSVGPEDGLDPRYVKKVTSGGRVNRKTLQLCHQVQQTLAAVLAACGDEVLRDLEVAAVSPAAGAGRLLVSFRPALSASVTEESAISAQLAKAAGLLRREVAVAIHRRKA